MWIGFKSRNVTPGNKREDAVSECCPIFWGDFVKICKLWAICIYVFVYLCICIYYKTRKDAVFLKNISTCIRLLSLISRWRKTLCKNVNFVRTCWKLCYITWAWCWKLKEFWIVWETAGKTFPEFNLQLPVGSGYYQIFATCNNNLALTP